MIRSLLIRRTITIFLILILLFSTVANILGTIKEPSYVYAESVAELIADYTQDKVDVTVDGVHYAIVTLNRYIDPENLQTSIPTYTPVKVYVDANGNPVSDNDTLRKIRIIDTARHVQCKHLLANAWQVVSERSYMLNSKALLSKMQAHLADPVALVVARTTQAYLSRSADADAYDYLLLFGFGPALFPFVDIIIDNKNAKYYSEILHDPKLQVAQSLFIDLDNAVLALGKCSDIENTYRERNGGITEFYVATEYLRHFYIGYGLLGSNWSATYNELAELGDGKWNEFFNWISFWSEPIINAWSRNMWAILKGIIETALTELGVLDNSWINEYYKGRMDALVWASKQSSYNEQQINPAGRYSQSLANSVVFDNLIPDLTVIGQVTVSPTVTETGSSISVTFTIKNQGDAPSGSFANRVFLSVPPYRWRTDITLGTYYMDSLDPGSSRSSTVSVPIPPNTPAGSYYVTVYTDAFREIEEKEDFGLIAPNNIGSTYPQMLSVTTPAKIDLTAQSISIPQSAGLGETIPVSFTVRNLESTASGEFTNRVFLSSSSTSNEIALGEFDMPSLAGGASRTTTVNFSIPQALPGNEYYVNVFADGLYTIRETNENNNIVSSYPNKIAIKSTPSPMIASNPSQIVFNPAIQGGYNPPSRALNIWNSADGSFIWSISDDAGWLNVFPASGTYTGSMQSVSVSADITGMSYGTYYANIEISSPEAGSKIVPVTLTVNQPSYPNLYISDVYTFNANPYIGEQITVGVTVRNNGDSQSGATKVKYYFSTSSSGSDIYLGENSIGPVNVGASTTEYQSVKMPDYPCERAYIVAVVNPDNTLTEKTYSDNINSYLLTVKPIDTEAPQVNELALRWGLGANQDEFKTGQQYWIVFNVTDDIAVDTLDFRFSYDDGNTWNDIVSGFVIGSNGVSNGLRWTIPSDAPLNDTLKIKVVARDTSGKETSRVTDSLKIIDGSPPQITVLSPKGGEVWDLGSTHEIIWDASSSSEIQKVRIYLYFADTSEYIATESVNDGTYTWTLPESSALVTDTGKIRIQVEDENRNEAEAWSSGYFSISDPSLPPPPPWAMPEVITTVPSGGSSSKGNGNPIISADSDGTVHMIYKYTEDSGIVSPPRVITQEIKYATFDGFEWSAPETIYSIAQETDASLTNYHSISLSDITVDNDGNPHIVWVDSVGQGLVSYNYNEVYYCHRENGVWSEPENISDNSKLADFEWTYRASMPEAKHLMSVAVVSGEIYVMGGDYRLSNYSYNPVNNTWTRKADLPNNGVDEGGSAVMNGKIYVFGGPFDYEVMIYNPVSDSWSTGSLMPIPRRGFSVAAVGDKIYLIGGSDNSLNPFDIVDCYDPATDAWSTMAAMPTPRGFASAAVVDGLIYVIGGRTKDSRTNVVEVFDPATNSWSSRSSMPTQRNSASIGVIGNQIYVVGGRNYYGDLANVEMYYTTTDIWVSSDSIITPRYGSVASVVNDKLYIIGGANDSGSLNIVEMGELQGVSDENPTVSGNPRISIDALENIHIIWTDGYSFNANWTRNGISNLYHRTKYPESGDFSSTADITQEGASDYDVVEDNTGSLHLVFKWDDVYYITWDSSTGWSDTTEIFTGIGHYLFSIACDTTNSLHIAWYNLSGSNPQRILYSSYNGIYWSDPKEISELIPDHSPIFPSVSVDSSGWPHIIWEDSAEGSIQYKRQSQAGWSEGIKLSLNSQYIGWASSSMAMSGADQLYVVYVNQYNGHSEIFFTHADMTQDTSSPVAHITAPLQGEQLSIGSICTINWSALDNIGVNSIALDYIVNASINESVSIAAGISNSGSYQWTVPNISSDKVQIRITAYDLNGNAGTYFSDYFSISDYTPPAVSILSPNGEEEWEVGSQHSIEWEATDNVEVSSVSLFISVDNGSNWDSIVSGLENSGSYLWNIPGTLSSACRLKVIALDAENNQGEAISNEAFSILSSNNPPDIPDNPIPRDGAIDISINTNLSWNCLDPDLEDLISYDIYFGNSTEMLLVATNQTQPEFNLSTLDYQSSYLWKVVATDSSGAATSSPVWTFLTELEPVPSPPSDLQIAGVAVNQTTLTWVDNSDNELGFIIERRIGVNESYTQICTVETNETSFYDTELTGGLDYYYRICSYSGTGNSSYSNEINVTTLMHPISTFAMSSDGVLIGQVGFAIVFNASASFDPDGTIASYEWDYGDGNTALGEIVTHSYLDAGSFTANLTITDNDGLTDIYSNDLTIVDVGDANMDGVVNASDIEAAARIVFGLDFSTPGSDPNNDGKISPADITAIEHIVEYSGATIPNVYSTALFMSEMTSGNGDATVIVDTPSQIPEGESLTVQIKVENLSDFDTSSFEVTFDNSVLWLRNVTSGNIDGTLIPVDIWGEISAGTVRILQNIPSTSGVSGDGYIAELHFNVVGAPGDTSPLHLHDCILGDINAQDIFAVLVDSEVQITEGVVTFPDPNLEAAIRDAIGKPTGDIYQSDLDGLTLLDASSLNISDLAGIEHCTDLIYLYLDGNQIIDISPLSGLTNVEFLSLSDNHIVSIDDISALVELRILYLDGNQIVDLIALESLTHIGESGSTFPLPCKLYSGNYIHLDLNNNLIADIESLVINTGIDSGDGIDIRNNPLNADAFDTHIPALQARGVTVFYGDSPTPTPEGYQAITDFSLGLDNDGVAGVSAGILEVQDPDTGLPVEVSIASYQAEFSYDGSVLQVLDVTLIPPFDGGAFNIDNSGGLTGFTSFAAAGADAPVEFASLPIRLVGSANDGTTGTLAFTAITDYDGEPLVPTPAETSYNFRRGDAKADGVVNIADALFIAQYLVGLRDPGYSSDKVHPVNAASVKHDGEVDKITIADALFIAQYLVGLRDAGFE